jgi:hypothetical protein
MRVLRCSWGNSDVEQQTLVLLMEQENVRRPHRSQAEL